MKKKANSENITNGLINTLDKIHFTRDPDDIDWTLDGTVDFDHYDILKLTRLMEDYE